MRGELLFALERPVLSIEMVVLQASSQLFIIAGTTDGSLVMWLLPMTDYSLPLSPLGMHNAHQVGTNSISASVAGIVEDRVRLRICSGGDDQSLSTCTVDVFDRECQASSHSFNIVSFVRLDVASASALKGAKLVDSAHILSIGYSQRLALWRLSEEATTLELLSMTDVDVADINSFAVSQANNLIAVGGMGVELFTMTEC